MVKVLVEWIFGSILYFNFHCLSLSFSLSEITKTEKTLKAFVESTIFFGGLQRDVW